MKSTPRWGFVDPGGRLVAPNGLVVCGEYALCVFSSFIDGNTRRMTSSHDISVSFEFYNFNEITRTRLMTIAQF
ncbi:hypothetical protein BRAS3843_670006 [Bradyrhizobium sp. STM 3843]|nr:hypothetical protein BRAS3843_670006 [Bradyrhizobium sp. STM 3843]